MATFEMSIASRGNVVNEVRPPLPRRPRRRLVLGFLYNISGCTLYEGISVDTDVLPQFTDYFRWRDDDTAEIEYIDTPDIDLFEGSWSEWGYAIHYEAPSLEAWIERWLASPLP